MRKYDVAFIPLECMTDYISYNRNFISTPAVVTNRGGSIYVNKTGVYAVNDGSSACIAPSDIWNGPAIPR